MRAYSNSTVFADPIETGLGRMSHASFAGERRERLKHHNGRGLLVAVLLSASFWAALGVAFLV